MERGREMKYKPIKNKSQYQYIVKTKRMTPWGDELYASTKQTAKAMQGYWGGEIKKI